MIAFYEHVGRYIWNYISKGRQPQEIKYKQNIIVQNYRINKM